MSGSKSMPRVGLVLLLATLTLGTLSGCQTARIPHTHLKVPVPSLSFIGLPWPGLGEGDLRELTWENAFLAMKNKMQQEYPFTKWKAVDWDALETRFLPRVKAAQEANDAEAYYLAVREFLYSIPDGHIGISDEPNYRRHAIGGGFGFAIARLDDGRVIAHVVTPGGAAEKAGMKWGAELLAWNGRALADAAASTPLLWAAQPPATAAERVREQYKLLPRAPIGAMAKVTFRNDGETASTEASLVAADDNFGTYEHGSVFEEAVREQSAPFAASVLPDNIGYIQVLALGATLSAPFPDRAFSKELQHLLDEGVTGIVLDLRRNRGGSNPLAAKLCSHFFTAERPYMDIEAFDAKKGSFIVQHDLGVSIMPELPYFGGPIVVLIDGSTLDAAEGIAAILKTLPNVKTVGAFNTHGSFATTGGGIDFPKIGTAFYPIGRALDTNRNILIESDKDGEGGIAPDVRIEITRDLLRQRFVKGEDVSLLRAQAVLKEMRGTK